MGGEMVVVGRLEGDVLQPHLDEVLDDTVAKIHTFQ
jgi:hypothetical protein